ncbi:MAG: sigma-70 family RNA polymerase sigma factor [Clostridiales bacterium]|nr:sigma-70 family RNA polymerase sigma factor [Clostridiales bacterium]
MDEEKKALLEKLFLDYSQSLYITARRKILNPDGARDVVLEVYLTAAEKADELYKHPNKAGWLYITLGNKIKEACRKKYVTDVYSGEKCPVVLEPLEDGEGRIREIPTEEEGFNEIFEAQPFEEYRGILKERELEYITYKFKEDMSVREIAEKMNISYTNSATMWWSIKKKLKKFKNL